MRATVAEPQGGVREGVAERSGRQTRDHRKTNRQRGRQRATSVLANAKSKTHQDVASRGGWRAGKVQVLTRGDLLRESAEGVSRGHSSDESARKNAGAKGRKNQRQAPWSIAKAANPAPTSATRGAEIPTVERTQPAHAMQSRQAGRGGKSKPNLSA